VSPAEFRHMGDLFAGFGTQVLGEGGYERDLRRVADIEKTLGIENLDKFTAKA